MGKWVDLVDEVVCAAITIYCTGSTWQKSRGIVHVVGHAHVAAWVSDRVGKGISWITFATYRYRKPHHVRNSYFGGDSRLFFCVSSTFDIALKVNFLVCGGMQS